MTNEDLMIAMKGRATAPRQRLCKQRMWRHDWLSKFRAIDLAVNGNGNIKRRESSTAEI